MSAWFKVPKHFLVVQNICSDRKIRALHSWKWVWVLYSNYGIYYHDMSFHREGVQISGREHCWGNKK